MEGNDIHLYRNPNYGTPQAGNLGKLSFKSVQTKVDAPPRGLRLFMEFQPTAGKRARWTWLEVRISTKDAEHEYVHGRVDVTANGGPSELAALVAPQWIWQLLPEDIEGIERRRSA